MRKKQFIVYGVCLLFVVVSVVSALQPNEISTTGNDDLRLNSSSGRVVVLDNFNASVRVDSPLIYENGVRLLNKSYGDFLYGGSVGVPLWYNGNGGIMSNVSFSRGNVFVSGNLTVNNVAKLNVTCFGSACIYQNGSGYVFMTNPCGLIGVCV